MITKTNMNNRPLHLVFNSMGQSFRTFIMQMLPRYLDRKDAWSAATLGTHLNQLSDRERRAMNRLIRVWMHWYGLDMTCEPKC